MDQSALANIVQKLAIRRMERAGDRPFLLPLALFAQVDQRDIGASEKALGLFRLVGPALPRDLLLV